MSGRVSASRSRPLKQRNIFASTGRFGPNMTPMVDVVLVILIFFMAATTIVGQEWFLRADLPEQRSDADDTGGLKLPTPMLDLELYVERDRVLVRGMGSDPIGIDEAIGRIGGMDPLLSEGLILRIGASDDVPYGSIVSVHDAGNAKKMRVAIR